MRTHLPLLLLLACGPPAPQPMPNRVDVLVIGAGPAGLMAARAAKKAGATVLVIDQDSRPGGSGIYATSALFAGTSTQRAAGVHDSAEAFARDLPGMTGATPSPWHTLYATRQLAVHDWLLAEGVHMALLQGQGATDRLHHVPGQQVVDALVRQLEPHELLLGCAVTTLSAPSGRVTGVEARCAEGPRTLQGAAVVLATGGFLRDKQLVQQLEPRLDGPNWWWSTGRYSDGSGLRMGQALGARTVKLEVFGLGANATPNPRRGREREGLLLIGDVPGPWLNRRGERFADERLLHDANAGRLLLDQPGGEAWVLLDDAAFGALKPHDPTAKRRGPAPTPEELSRGPHHHQGTSAEALARAAGMDAGALQAAVDTWNAGPGGGEVPFRDDDLQLRPIGATPWHLLRLAPTATKAYGGLVVSERGEVLNEAGPIPGLYASGELTGMAGGSLVGDRGLDGTLSAVLVSGQVAGEGAGAARLGD